jgi:hypothetical protein
MNIFIEKFYGLLSSEVASRLDRNFGRVSKQAGPIITAIASYTFKADDEVDSVQANATAAAMTVYLPISPTGNRRRRVIKTDASANTVTVSGNGALINGAATYVLAAQYDRLWVEPTGTGWLIIN